MKNSNSRPNRSQQVHQSLPYYNLTNVLLNIADSAVRFYHDITDHRGQVKTVSGVHKLTANQIATLNAGGIVTLTDKNGNSCDINL
jgi:hypothetical protein